MNIEDYLRAVAATREDPWHPYRTDFFHGLYVDKIDLGFFAFIRKAACAHTWLQMAVWRTLKPDDPRREVLERASELTEACVRMMAHELKESDPFLLQPGGIAFGPFDADGPEGWLAPGLSALLLELVLNKAGKVGDEQYAQFHWPLRAMGAGFGLERRYALAEAGRMARDKDDPGVQSAIAAFIPPGELAWGTEFILEAASALDGRIKSRKELLRAAVLALHEASGLPRDPWPYLEPHLDRHAALLGLSRIKKFGLRIALKLV